MWFGFGIITLISFSIYAWYERKAANWSGQKKSVDGDSDKNGVYQFKILKEDDVVSGLKVGVSISNDIQFKLKRESSSDRFYKKIGFSTEHQTGNKTFDDLVYIISDNAQFHQQISSSIKIQQAIIEIFDLGKKINCEVKGICSNSGQLWIEFYSVVGFVEELVGEDISNISSRLRTVSNELEKVPSERISLWKDSFVIKSAFILAASTGLAINGFVQLLRIYWTNFPFTIDTELLLKDSILIGAGFSLVLIIVSIFILGRSARSHLVFIELFFIGTFGAISTTYTTIRDINMEFDTSEVVEYEVPVQYKKVTKSKRRSDYYVHLIDWNDKSQIKVIEVSASFYDSVAYGDLVLVQQQSGYLAYRWVPSVQKLE